MANLVWRVKLVVELQPAMTTETEVARIERDEEANLAELGLRLEEAKQLTAALQAQMVPAQVTTLVLSAFAPLPLVCFVWSRYRASCDGGRTDGMHWVRLASRFGTA